MALHKLNTIHSHLVDDQGWRIEIKKYPKLTACGPPTDYSSMNPKEATRSRTELPGGFFTQDDIKEIVAYATARFINVVPEIEMPGHSGAVVAAYPELGNKKQIAEAGAHTCAGGAAGRRRCRLHAEAKGLGCGGGGRRRGWRKRWERRRSLGARRARCCTSRLRKPGRRRRGWRSRLRRERLRRAAEWLR